MSNTSIDGLVSGLSTSSIIEQLMSLERQPQLRLAQKKAGNDQVISAYQAINSKLAAMRTAADNLAKASTWSARTATSSSTAVTVSATGDALPGRFTFDVTSVAKAQSYVYSTAVASTDVIVADGDLTVTKGNGAPVTVDVGDGSLASVVSAINASSAGVRAAAVQTGSGVRLQLTSTSTGAASDFTVDGLTVGGVSVVGTAGELVAGSDAVLTVGPGSPAQYTITSSGNTFTPMPGVSLTVKEPATGVTIDVGRNDAAVADAVKAFVDAANAALGEISKATAYDATTKKGAILISDAGVRSLKQRILQQVSSAVGDGTASAASAGIELQRDGTLKFNRETFLAKLTADPSATARLFQAGAVASDSRVSFTSASDRTVENPGDPWDVVITQAATRAEALLTVGTVDGTTTLNLVMGTKNVSVDLEPGDTAAMIVDRINEASADEGLGLFAQVSGGDVVVRATAYGSASSFSLTAANGLTAGATTAGKDVVGTIDGKAATGTGQQLSATEGDATGLVLRITATADEVATAGGTLALGDVTYTPGVAQRLDSVGYWAIDSVSGSITASINGRRAHNTSIDNQIEAWDLRLSLREAALRKQFANLENALGKLRSQSTWLAGQLGSLPSNSSSST